MRNTLAFVGIIFSVGLGCKPEAFLSTDDDLSSGGGNQKLKIVLDDVDLAKAKLVIAAPATSTEVVVCENEAGEACEMGLTDEDGNPIAFGSRLIYVSKDYRFFMPNGAVLLESGLVLSFVARDSSGQELDTRIVEFNGGDGGDGSSGSSGSSGGGGSSSAPADIRSNLERNCGGAGCHDNTYVQSPRTLKFTDTIERLRANDRSAMPRGPAADTMSDADKQAIVDYINSL